jgi:hypothetical protein
MHALHTDIAHAPTNFLCALPILSVHIARTNIMHAPPNPNRVVLKFCVHTAYHTFFSTLHQLASNNANFSVHTRAPFFFLASQDCTVQHQILVCTLIFSRILACTSHHQILVCATSNLHTSPACTLQHQSLVCTLHTLISIHHMLYTTQCQILSRTHVHPYFPYITCFAPRKPKF